MDCGKEGKRCKTYHLVNLLERQALGLGNKEVGVDEGRQAETAPDEEHTGLHVGVTGAGAHHVRGDDSDDGVPQPVGGGREGNTTRSDREREDLADDNPGTRTPSRGEEEDEDGNEGDLSVDSSNVVGSGVASGVKVRLVETNRHTDNGDDEQADTHTSSADNQDETTTKLLNGVERDGGRQDVDESEDQRHQEGVADGTGRLEEGRGVVEDEVDTGPLLHHLERGTQDRAAQVGLATPEAALEAVGPRSEPGGVGDKLALILLVGDDLSKLNLDELGVTGLTTEAGERVGSLVQTTALDEVTGGVGQEEQASGEEDTEDELDTDGDTVRAGVIVVLGLVNDTGCEQQANGNAELVAGNQSTTNLTRALCRKRLLLAGGSDKT